MKVVIDTNVFVSSVFGGFPDQVVQCWFEGRITLCLSEPIVTEYQRVLRELGAIGEAEERALIEAFASEEGVLYTADPLAIEGASPDPDDDKFLECALELEADCIASGDSDLLDLESYMGIPILTPRELLEQIGEAPSE
ncbi:putative toxin-antitoxin system toxin component, PIN family [Salinibacter ruber]|uniref:putative toxin-antitoxin system toxin component, PIN family n=1 Tax=Salinibacter ruber TaxID=146919 RepID=UPI002167DD26|nr:putative toxin-antitoxin system toxin component, PIN family [Salinibacter ruber]